MQDDHAVGEVHRFLLVVGDKDAGDVSLVMESSDPLAQLNANLRVESSEGLVEQQERWLGCKGPGESDALTLATRELARVAVPKTAELNEIEKLADRRLDFSMWSLLHTQTKGNVLADGHVSEERVMLEDEADLTLLHRGVGRNRTIQDDLSAVRLLEASDDAKNGALAASTRAQKRHELTAGDLERDVVDDKVCAESLADVADNDGHFSGHTLVCYAARAISFFRFMPSERRVSPLPVPGAGPVAHARGPEVAARPFAALQQEVPVRTVPPSRDAETVAIRPGVLSPPAISPRARDLPCNPCPWQPTSCGLAEPFRSAMPPLGNGMLIAGRYRLIQRLGKGGMGEVWSARHEALHTVVAIKFLLQPTGNTGGCLALERFRLEAQVSAHLSLETQHVVAVHDAGVDPAGAYLVMEHVQGRTLRAEISALNPVPPKLVSAIVNQVCEALSVAHHHGIVHRDLKPSNVLVVDGPDGETRVKVADFGIAKAHGPCMDLDLPEDTAEGFMLGSPAYMSPEQLRGGPTGPHVDLWSLGVIAYEAITGRKPFPGRLVADLLRSVREGCFSRPTTILATLPVQVDEWFERAFARHKDDRFPSAACMARELHRAVVGVPSRRLPGDMPRLFASSPRISVEQASREDLG